MILPRFTTSSDSESPLVFDRQAALVCRFATIANAQAVARLLNARPAMVEAFYWSTTEQGAQQ